MKRGGPLLLVHKNLPVGRLTKYIETTHPESGAPAIAVHGYIHNDGSTLFDDVWKEFLYPTSPVGFSIGARPLKAHYEDIEGKSVRVFDKIELYEVSVVCSFGKVIDDIKKDGIKVITIQFKRTLFSPSSD